MKRLCTILLAAVLIIAGFAPARAQTQDVGEVHFANSGAPAAQGAFLRGLAQLHNFEYDAAASLFKQAQEADPGFAVAYWGEAMTYTHPVWMEQDRDAALKALSRLGATPEARAAKAKTEREKDYLRAVEILYGEGDKKARDFAYADAMASLHGKYPNDVDAAAFHALALLGTAHEGRDFAIYMRSAAILEPLFPANPRHPGLAHYLIHSYDDPIHAPLGLRAALAYSKIAPSAGHAQHMCSHIFVAMGMWDDVVEANEAAMKVVNDERAHHGRGPSFCGHYPSWLEYGYLQQGRFGDARRMTAACQATVLKVPAAAPGAPPMNPQFMAVATFVDMRSRYLIDTEDWTGEVAALRVPRGMPIVDHAMDFVDGLAAVGTGRLDEATRAFERLKQDAAEALPMIKTMDNPAMTGRVGILEQQLGGLIDVAEGRTAKGIEALRAAADAEGKLAFDFGPPAIEKPSHELLGEALLAAGNAKDARVAFEQALARAPERTTSLVGLMRAAEKTGDRRKADEVRAKLKAIWKRADHPIATEASR